ncbi:MAG: flavodoxin family protein [Deltaproteobacteria bacterium]|nr:flavodoxin family protein [Deltaproteobacteria bacterium]
MSVVAILGSPRPIGNSTILAEAAIKAIEAEPSDTRKFVINDLNVKGCQACYSCKTKTEFCAVKDDLSPALAAVANADYVIVTSPIYIGEITAQFKAFIDRSFSFLVPDYKNKPNPSRLTPGRKLLFVQTQGNPDTSTYQKRFDFYLDFFRRLGFKADGLIAAGLSPDPTVEIRPELIKEVEAKATALLKA